MNYDELKKELGNIKNLTIKVEGRSWDNREIFSISTFFDEKKPWVIIQSSIHAREHLSSDLVMQFVKIIDSNFEYFRSLEDFPNICFVPMINPDGVCIALLGVNAIKNIKLRTLMKKVIGNSDFRLIKCNARGVDINNNFNAKFDFHRGANTPSTHGFKGEKPESERETEVLVKLTKKVKPIFTISYHLKGEEIYYDFGQSGNILERDRRIAEVISTVTGYKIVLSGNSSFGGYKDWCVQKLKIPAVTIELGRDEIEHPVPNVELENIIEKNTSTLHALCVIVRIWKEYKEKI